MLTRALSLTVIFFLSGPLVRAQQCVNLFLQRTALQTEAQAYIHHGNYITQRSYYEYSKAFGADFTKDMLTLNEDDVWVDLGAGTGRALKDFSEYKILRKETPPHLLGVSTQNSDYDAASKSIGWLGGRLWENIPKHELPPRIDRATDFYGILSYTDQVSNYLNEVFKRMPVGGKFYTLISDRDLVQTDQNFLGRLFSSTSLVQYLKQVSNLHVEEKIVWNYLTLQKTRVLTLTKTGQVQFPDLEIISYREDSPPYRTFLKN